MGGVCFAPCWVALLLATFRLSSGGAVPAAQLDLPERCVSGVSSCVEVSGSDELHAALSDQTVLEIVVVVPEILLEAPVFTPDSPVTVRRDVLVRRSGVGNFPALINRMGGLPSDTVIFAKACIMFYGIRLDGWMELSEAATLKQPEDIRSILGASGVMFKKRDMEVSPYRDNFEGRWMIDFGHAPFDPPHPRFTGLILQECELDMKLSVLWQGILGKSGSPWMGLIDLLKASKLFWTVGPMQFPLRAIFYHDKAIMTFWSWAHTRFYNTTIYVKGIEPLLPADLPVLEPQTECQSANREALSMDYIGDQSSPGSVPGSDPACVPWKDVHYMGANFSSLEGNSCRNPGTIHAGTFCFKAVKIGANISTVFHNLEPCDIPSCRLEGGPPFTDNCQREEDNGRSYNGTLSVSESGAPCVNWVEVMYAEYFPADMNYCRNPSGEKDRLWCYTGLDYSWEYCDVKMCPTGSMPGFPWSSDILDGLLEAGPDAAASSPDPDEGGAAQRPSGPGQESTDGKSSSSPGNRPLIIAISVASIAVLLLSLAVFYSRHWLGRKIIPSVSQSKERVGRRYSRSFGGISYTSSNPGSHSRAGQPFIDKICVLEKDPVQLGLIQLHKKVGNGCFGQVWQSQWMGVEVACKKIRLDLMPTEKRDVILRGMEARVVSELSHPNIVRTFQIYHVCHATQASQQPEIGHLQAADVENPGEESELVQIQKLEQLWIVQEFCHGGDLWKFVEMCSLNGGPTSLKTISVIRILKQIMLGLKYLHASSIVHGDLKCENVLLDREGNSRGSEICVKVADFGLSHALPEGMDQYTSSNYVMGDYAYMAPEALLDLQVSAKMDTFSFGLIVFELATGMKAPSGPNSSRHAAELAAGKRPQFPEETHEGLKRIAEACWAQRPEDRPSDDQIIEKLNGLMQQTGIVVMEDVHPGSSLQVDEKTNSSGYFMPQITNSKDTSDKGYTIPAI